MHPKYHIVFLFILVILGGCGDSSDDMKPNNSEVTITANQSTEPISETDQNESAQQIENVFEKEYVQISENLSVWSGRSIAHN